MGFKKETFIRTSELPPLKKLQGKRNKNKHKMERAYRSPLSLGFDKYKLILGCSQELQDPSGNPQPTQTSQVGVCAKLACAGLTLTSLHIWPALGMGCSHILDSLWAWVWKLLWWVSRHLSWTLLLALILCFPMLCGWLLDWGSGLCPLLLAWCQFSS